MKLKKEVKKILAIGVGLIIILVLVGILENQKNNAIVDCVKAGNPYSVCENGLK